MSGIAICIVRLDLFKDPWSQMLNSAPATPLANGQWEARVRDLPVSPSPMPEVGLADPSVRRAGPARSTAFAHLKTFIPAGQPRLRRAGREETSTLSNRVSPCTFVAAWPTLRFRPGSGVCQIAPHQGSHCDMEQERQPRSATQTVGIFSHNASHNLGQHLFVSEV